MWTRGGWELAARAPDRDVLMATRTFVRVFVWHDGILFVFGGGISRHTTYLVSFRTLLSHY